MAGRNWLRHRNGVAEGVRVSPMPSLEPLEPRLLLSADPIGLDPLLALEHSPAGQAISLDVERQDHATEPRDPSLILTFLSLPDEQYGTPRVSTCTKPDGESAERSEFAVTESLETEPASRIESAIQVSVELSESPHTTEDGSTVFLSGDDADITLAPENVPVQIRGPPAGHFLAPYQRISDDSEIATDSFDSASAESILGAPELLAADLPGLHLDASDPANYAGQIVYLDFGGAERITYNGPVAVGPFDVPRFQAPGRPAGQEEAIISQTLSLLEETFASMGVIVTAMEPPAGIEHSRVWIGGDDSAFAAHGSFAGIAEQIDVGNRDRSDTAYVFSESILILERLVCEENRTNLAGDWAMVRVAKAEALLVSGREDDGMREAEESMEVLQREVARTNRAELRDALADLKRILASEP